MCLKSDHQPYSDGPGVRENVSATLGSDLAQLEHSLCSCPALLSSGSVQNGVLLDKKGGKQSCLSVGVTVLLTSEWSDATSSLVLCHFVEFV